MSEGRKLGRKISKERQEMALQNCTEGRKRTRIQVKETGRKAVKERQSELNKDGTHVVAGHAVAQLVDKIFTQNYHSRHHDLLCLTSGGM
jgi:hypothetical protein